MTGDSYEYTAPYPPSAREGAVALIGKRVSVTTTYYTMRKGWRRRLHNKLFFRSPFQSWDAKTGTIHHGRLWAALKPLRRLLSEKVEFDPSPHVQTGVLTDVVEDADMAKLCHGKPEDWVAILLDGKWATFLHDTTVIEEVPDAD